MQKTGFNTLLREPLLHFLLLGSLLFFIYGILNDEPVENDRRIVFSQTEINRLALLWQKKWQRPPTQAELQDFIESRIREEVMYREALLMGLDKNDSVVKRRLAQKIEFISADLAAQVEPTEKELSDFLEKHNKKFLIPGQISFSHIYFNNERRGERAESEIRELLAELATAGSDTGKETIDITSTGDPFMLGQIHEQLTKSGVSRLFGENFTEKLFTLSVGDWQGPIHSAYGLHLVRITNKTPDQKPELDAVRDKVKNEWYIEQRRQIDKAFYQSLRQRYEIIIEQTSPIEDAEQKTR